MLGIIVTLLAVLAVICFAFHYSDNPLSRSAGSDLLPSMIPKYFKQKDSAIGRDKGEGSAPPLNRQS